MSSQVNSMEEEEIAPLQRPPSPPLHTTFAARGLHVGAPILSGRTSDAKTFYLIQAQNFPAHKPRDLRIPSPQAITHVAWSCDGKRLGGVGIDKITRIWTPETSVRIGFIFYESISCPNCRWKQELQPTSLAVTRKMLTIYHGIPPTQSYFAHQVKKTEELCFGTHDVSFACIVCIVREALQD